MLNEHSLVDHLPIWTFDEDVLVYKDGSLGFGFKLGGIDITSSTDETVNSFTTNLENFLTTIKEGYKFQVFYKLSNDVSKVMEAHEKISDSFDELYDPIKQSRLNFMNQAKDRGEYFRPEIFLFIKSSKQNFKKQGLFSKEKIFTATSKTQFDNFKNSFLTDITNIETGLAAYHLYPSRLPKDEWIKLIYEYFNLERSTNLTAPDIRSIYDPFAPSLANQLILSDCQVANDYLKLGNIIFKTITIKTLPDTTYGSMMDGFLKIAFPFWLSFTTEIPDQKKEYDKLNLKRRMTHSMVAGSKKMADMESESKLSQIEGLISELLESSEKITNSSLTLMIWDQSPEGLEQKTQAVLRAFRTLNQAEGIVETYPNFHSFVKSFPGSCDGLRMKKMKSSNSAHLLPVFTSWEGNDKAVCIIPNRDGVLVKIDPFHNRLPNWNGLVIGSSGSGKSFTICQLVLMFYGSHPKPKIVWLDNGASSKNIIEFLNGEFLDVKLDSGICLNPFDLEPGVEEPPPSKIKLILAVLETICKDENNKGLPKRDKALLEEVILKTYAKVKHPTLSDFRKLLLEAGPDLKQYAEILFSWTGKSAFGKLLDGQTNIKLNKNLVTVEMKGLDVYPELQSVFLLILTDFIQREAASDPNQKYLLIVDEAWKLFETSTGASFTIEAYRTFRKFNAGIWAISQNINDFNMIPGIANAILQNTPSRIILKQRGVDWKKFSEVLTLNEAEVEAIKSLRQEKGKFSEIYFIQDEARSILKLAPDSLGYWLCTSDPLDKAKIEDHRLNNPNLSFHEVIQQVAKGVQS